MTVEQGTSRLPDGSKKGKGKVSIDRSLVYCTVVLSPASAVLTNRDFLFDVATSDECFYRHRVCFPSGSS